MAKAKKKDDWDWKLFEFPLQELEMILTSAPSNTKDTIELHDSRKERGNHV
jgi:hypothetical protein